MFNFSKKLTYENIKSTYEKGKIERQKDVDYFVQTNLQSVLNKIDKNAKNGINETYYGIETRIGFDDGFVRKTIADEVIDILNKMGFKAINNVHAFGGIIVKIQEE